MPKPLRAGAEDQIDCIEPLNDEDFLNTITALLLGFAYGLQYDNKSKGPCFENIIDSVLAFDLIVQLLGLIF